MDPMTMLALANAGIQLGGSLFGNQGTENINPYTEAQMASLNKQYADAMAGYRAQQEQANRYNDQLSGVGRNVNATTSKIDQVNQPGANDWYDNWLNQVPGYQQIASNLADSATSDLGRSVEEQTKLKTQEAMTQAMNAFGGNGAYSGAAQAALGQAVAQPMAEAQVAMNQNKAGIESNAFNSMAGQGQGLTQNSTQNEFSNAMMNLMNQLQGYGTQGSILQSQAGLANQQAGQYAGLASGAQSNLSAMADPMMQQKANPFEPLMTGANAAFNIATNPDYGLLQPKSSPVAQAPTQSSWAPSMPQYTNSYDKLNRLMNPQPFQPSFSPSYSTPLPAFSPWMQKGSYPWGSPLGNQFTLPTYGG